MEFDFRYIYCLLIYTLYCNTFSNLFDLNTHQLMPRNYSTKKPYYLDVAQYITTETFRYAPSPKINPVQNQNNQIKTPFNIPSILEYEGNQPSPYLKELLQNQDIQFHDFTLEGAHGDEYDGSYDYNDDFQDDDDIILEDDAENQKSEGDYDSQDNANNNPNDEYCYVEPSKLNLKTFRAIMAEFINIELSDEQTRQFIYDYLMDDQLEHVDQMTTKELIEAAQYNLRPLGPISWLQRKNKVSKYLQKKKKRIWNKKINYDCRKKVAENRLRIKGKFVTPQQAFTLLGIDENSQMSMGEIRLMLDQKFRG